MENESSNKRVSFIEAVKSFYKGYFDFKGRTTRAGYWWAILSVFIVYVVLFIATMLAEPKDYYDSSILSGILVIIILLFSLGILVPLLSLSVRRLRDTGLQSKTILVLYILYYAFYSTLMFSMYSSLIGFIATMANSYGSEYMSEMMPGMYGSMSSSPVILFCMSVLSIFMSVNTVLPSDMLATESKHPVLTAIFRKKA